MCIESCYAATGALLAFKTGRVGEGGGTGTERIEGGTEGGQERMERGRDRKERDQHAHNQHAATHIRSVSQTDVQEIHMLCPLTCSRMEVSLVYYPPTASSGKAVTLSQLHAGLDCPSVVSSAPQSIEHSGGSVHCCLSCQGHEVSTHKARGQHS